MKSESAPSFVNFKSKPVSSRKSLFSINRIDYFTIFRIRVRVRVYELEVMINMIIDSPVLVGVSGGKSGWISFTIQGLPLGEVMGAEEEEEHLLLVEVDSRHLIKPPPQARLLALLNSSRLLQVLCSRISLTLPQTHGANSIQIPCF